MISLTNDSRNQSIEVHSCLSTGARVVAGAALRHCAKVFVDGIDGLLGENAKERVRNALNALSHNSDPEYHQFKNAYRVLLTATGNYDQVLGIGKHQS